MYYLITVSGSHTIKVKGANVPKDKLNLELFNHLVNLFINKEMFKIDGLTQFISLPKHQGSGVVIKEDVIKYYALGQNNKRE